MTAHVHPYWCPHDSIFVGCGHWTYITQKANIGTKLDTHLQ